MASTPALQRVDPHEDRGRFYLAVARFSTTKVGGWLATNVSWKLDPFLLKLTRGRFSTARPLISGLLETRGARSGKPRRNATLYFHDGEHVIIIASKRGLPEHPAWYHNLRRHPDVTFGGIPFRAEAVEDEAERERLWGLADRVFPPFVDYRNTTTRAIPIVRLIPR
jgi:deazaflavin-dependent oxidoreductase (nitroreductase family)